MKRLLALALLLCAGVGAQTGLKPKTHHHHKIKPCGKITDEATHTKTVYECGKVPEAHNAYVIMDKGVLLLSCGIKDGEPRNCVLEDDLDKLARYVKELQ